jgi:outer membrane receptor protein involved in Fe transport
LNLGVDGFLKFGHNQLDLAQFAGSQVFAPLNYRKSRGWGSDLSLSYQREPFSGYVNFSYAVLQAQNITAGQFLADDPAEVAYIARHWVTLDDSQLFTGSAGVAYQLWGFLITGDAIWGSGYRRGFANSGELPPILQFDAAVVRSIKLPRLGTVEGRLSVINLFDHSYQIRNGSGIGVFSPQYGPRRAVYGGLKIPLSSLSGRQAGSGTPPSP